MNLHQAFDTQIENLITKGYPGLAQLSSSEFITQLEPLKSFLPSDTEFVIDVENGILSFVLVCQPTIITAEAAMSLVEREGKQGVTKLFPHDSQAFTTIATEHIPTSDWYLLLHVDRGKNTINMPPNQALQKIRNQSRLPLTIAEGIAIITHYPEFLQKNNCYSLLASRHTGDQRVPAIWINSQKHPNLGWCWDGNPHTWLGSASAQQRVTQLTF